MSSSIVIKLISDNSIYPDLKSSTSLIVGRNEQTKIESTRCAREQGSESINHFMRNPNRMIIVFSQ